MRSEVISCGLVGRYRCFGGACPEDGGSMFLQNVGIYIFVHMALQPGRPTSTKVLIKNMKIKVSFSETRCITER
jgi:hypothetical protein